MTTEQKWSLAFAAIAAITGIAYLFKSGNGGTTVNNFGPIPQSGQPSALDSPALSNLVNATAPPPPNNYGAQTYPNYEQSGPTYNILPAINQPEQAVDVGYPAPSAPRTRNPGTGRDRHRDHRIPWPVFGV